MLSLVFASILTAGLTGSAFMVCTLVSLALGVLVALTYMFKNRFTQSMAITLALLPVMVQAVILLVNGNLGAGVAVAGAFSLVRFRSVAGTARDITNIFLAMTIGLATGMGYVGIAILLTVLVCAMQLLYHAIGFGGKQQADKELKITIPETLDYSGLFDDIFREFTSRCELVQVKTTNMGSLYNLQYEITLEDNSREKEMIDALRCRNGNLDIICGRVPVSREAL